MTIGDEKVVAWLDEGGLTWDTKESAAEWCENTEPVGLIPQSAYAELAAEKDERIEELKVLANHLIAEKANAESRLAELRGKLEGLADNVEGCGVITLDWIINELRTLAAADGGGG